MTRIERIAGFALSAILLISAIAQAATATPAVGTHRPPAAQRPAPTGARQSFTYGRFGAIQLYYQTPSPSNVVLFVSGDGGWNQGVVDMARELTTTGALVVGIDITHYLKQLEAADEKCSYPASDFEELSKFVQQKLDFPKYITPVLVGYSSGATLVYAILVQAPSNTFRGALSLGFCPDLEVSRPFCPGNGLRFRPLAKGKGIWFEPATTLEVPFVALQGTIDQVCFPDSTISYMNRVKNGRVVVLPRVGHGYSVPRNWMPQFREAFASIITSKPVDAPMERSDELQDLPLIEDVAGADTAASSGPGIAGTNAPSPEDPRSETGHSGGSGAAPERASIDRPVAHDVLVVHVTGDGGWGVTDRGLSGTLADDGIPVVGLNSLHYFWHSRTPEEAANDLARIMRHYLALWHKERVVLVGYSFGADVLPFMYNRLPDEMRTRVPLIVLLGPSERADFQFHVTDWIGEAGADSYPVPPEIAKIEGPGILCFHGNSDEEGPCGRLDPAKVTSIVYEGGHRVGGRYQEIAQRIIEAIR